MPDEPVAALPLSTPTRETRPASPGLAGPHPAWLLLAYLAAYLTLRLMEGGGLERDDAESVYLAQDLRLGYGTQPPLYVWLQWLAFQVFGQNRFALAGVKVAALATLYVAVARAARPLVGRRAAVAAGAALLLFPQFAWEALRIQTHSVLAAALAAVALWAYIGLLDQPTRRRYAGFGVACGLGLLAKYNVGIFLAGIVGAGVLVPEHRGRLWRRDAWIAPAVAILVVLPHLGWIVLHPDAAVSPTLLKMQDGTGALSYGPRVLSGAVGLLSALASFVALPCLAFAAVGRRLHAPFAFDVRAPAGRFMAWVVGLCLLLLAALVLTGRVGLIKERWLMPILFALPLAALACMPGLRADRVCRAIGRAACIAAIAVLAALAGRSWLGPAWGRVVAAHHPYALLADALARDRPTAIVTDDVMLAGNLHFARPGLRTWLLDDALHTPARLHGPVVLVTQFGDMDTLANALRAARPAARPAGASRLVLPLQLGARGEMAFELRRFEEGVGEGDAGPTAGRAPQTNAPGARPR